MALDYLLVVVITVLAGAWSIPIGILLGLPPEGVWVASVVGSLAWTLVVLYAGGRLRTHLFERYLPTVENRIQHGRARRIVDRWGAAGLAVVGGLVLGPTMTLMAALVFDVPRARFAAWYAASVVLGFALLVLFWDWVL